MSKLTITTKSGTVLDLDIEDTSSFVFDPGGPNEIIINPGWFKAITDLIESNATRIGLAEDRLDAIEASVA